MNQTMLKSTGSAPQPEPMARSSIRPVAKSGQRPGGHVEIIDAALPLIFGLQLFKAQEELAIGLLLIWLAARLVLQAWRQRSEPAPWALVLLGLLLVNMRVILFGEESAPSGPSDFLLITLGLAAGFERSDTAWRTSLQCIGMASVTVSLVLLLYWPGSLSLGIGLEEILSKNRLGLGGLNRLATLAMLFSLAAAYGGLLESKVWRRWSLVGASLLGYALCLRTESRLAMLAPPLAMGLAYLIPRLRSRVGWSRTLAICLAGCGALAAMMAFWWFQLASDNRVNLASDLGRLEAARCWSAISLSGHNRFLLGIGFGDRARDFCAKATAYARGSDWHPMGHAHNTLAQILGETGTLGLLAVVLLLVVLVLALIGRLNQQGTAIPWGWRGISLTEAALGLNLLLLFNVITTTVHLSNPASQCLIGYLSATAFWARQPDHPDALSHS